MVWHLMSVQYSNSHCIEWGQELKLKTSYLLEIMWVFLNKNQTLLFVEQNAWKFIKQNE